MINVFIIDDSILIRNILKKMLSSSRNIKIIGEAPNPVDALQEFKNTGLPDVFILDIEMPKMDGITFLKKLQQEKPIPTIIFSTIVNDGSSKAIEAFQYGASDVVLKPQKLNNALLAEFTDEFIEKIKAAAQSKSINTQDIHNKQEYKLSRNSKKIIAIGASTGGVQTIEAIVKHLHPMHPPILITQHMPAGFTKSFAKRLNQICQNSTILEAQNNEIIESGTIYIAPGDLHLEILNIGKDKYKTVLKNYPKVSSHKPSVDVLFKSMSKEVKSNSVAFLLTGMGKDGANGLKLIKEIDGMTYGQDEKSSIVYGMPKVAFTLGYVQKQVNIDDIITIINEME
jgi:two-component system chemotaxis response regulator CheB